MTPPNEDYTLPLDDLRAISDLYNKWLLDFADQHDIDGCNLADKIPPTTDYLYDDCHYNEGGARKVALVIAQCAMKSSRLKIITD